MRERAGELERWIREIRGKCCGSGRCIESESRHARIDLRVHAHGVPGSCRVALDIAEKRALIPERDRGVGVDGGFQLVARERTEHEDRRRDARIAKCDGLVRAVDAERRDGICECLRNGCEPVTVRIRLHDRGVARGRHERRESRDVRTQGTEIDREFAANHYEARERAATIHATGMPKKSVCATNSFRSTNVFGSV
jgi:hypothetical protein